MVRACVDEGGRQVHSAEGNVLGAQSGRVAAGMGIIKANIY